MTRHIDQAELDNLRDIVQAVADVLAPIVVKLVAPVRDYRKEAWLVGLQSPQKWEDSDKYADKVLAEFDKRFPK